MPEEEKPISWVEEVEDDGIDFYILTPVGLFPTGKEIIPNPDNLPVDIVQKSFENNELFIRFAYNIGKNLLYLQDRTIIEPLINDGDILVRKGMNKILRFIRLKQEQYFKKMGKPINEIEPPGTETDGYGDPPGVCIARKLSDFHSTWVYLNRYLQEEFKDYPSFKDNPNLMELAKPKDINVCEFYATPEEEESINSSDYVIGFEPKGRTFRGKTFHGPTIFVNKGMHKSKKFTSATPDDIDYGLIGIQLSAFYLRYFKAITNASITPIEQITLLLGMRMDDIGYDVYYAIYNPRTNEPVVYEYKKNQTTIINEEQARDILEERLKEKFVAERPNDPIPEKMYDGPIVVFSYLPHRKQLIWNNIDPHLASGIYETMLKGIRNNFQTHVFKDQPQEIIESFDPSTALPQLKQISSYTVVWEYLKNIMGPRYGFDPTQYNIEVLECPRPVGDAIAVYFRSKQETDEKVPDLMNEIQLTYGISVKFPFIAFNSLIKNIGTKYYALIHEYEHYIDEIFKKTKKVNISSGSFNERGISAEERDKRFMDYINNPHEHTAHLEQMVYMLHMGYGEQEVLNMFGPKENYLYRAEYRKLLQEAKNIYRVDRSNKITPKQPASIPTSPFGIPVPMVELPDPIQGSAGIRTAAVDISINPWFWQGLQENINTKRHKNDSFKTNPKISPEPIRVQVPTKAKDTIEGLLSKDWDSDEDFFKTIEQLLAESRI